MDYEIHIHGFESSYWMKEFIGKKLAKLDRYLTPASHLSVSLTRKKEEFEACIEVIHPVQSFHCSSHGDDLYMAFSDALEKMARDLNRAQQIRRGKVESNYFSLKNKIA
jgi:ribosomal subunit interface protein